MYYLHLNWYFCSNNENYLVTIVDSLDKNQYKLNYEILSLEIKLSRLSIRFLEF